MVAVYIFTHTIALSIVIVGCKKIEVDISVGISVRVSVVSP